MSPEDILTNLKTQQRAHRLQLSTNEVDAVKLYAGHEFEAMNSYLRGDVVSGKMFLKGDIRAREYVKELNKVIDSTPGIKHDLTVFRGVGDPKLFGASNIGDVIIEEGFLSTTVDQDVVQFFTTEDVPTMFQIRVPEGKKGFVVNSIRGAGKKAESEVLFDSGIRLRVIGKENRKVAGINFKVVLAEML
jgi:hypothetical protein